MSANESGLKAACLCLSIMCLLTACQPGSMTAERLISECAAAMGEIESLETMRLVYYLPDHTGLSRYEIRRPNQVRMGDHLVFDGEQASWLPGMSPDGTLLVPQEEWPDFPADIAWYVPAFFDYPAEYLGMETVDGVETHVLQVTLPLGAVMTYNLDAETYLVHRASARVIMYGEEYTPERTFGDYRMVDGILYPHTYTYAGRDGVEVLTATMESLEFNVPLDDDRFAVPTED